MTDNLGGKDVNTCSQALEFRCKTIRPYLGTASRCIGELGALHPRCLKARYGVDSVEKTEEANTLHWATEGFPESLHELIHLVAFRLILLGAIRLATLPLRECFPRERDHLLVSVREQPYVVQHLGEEPSDVGSPREPEKVNLVARVVESHQEAVAPNDVVVETRPNGRVFCFHIP